MKADRKIIILFFFMGAVVWLLNTALDSFVFDQGTFQSRLFPGFDSPALHARLLGLVSFLILAFVWSVLPARRRAAIRALQESDEKFRLFYENSPVAYQSLDAEGRFLDVNPAWCRIMGYTREEVLSRWFGDFPAPSYREHLSACFSRLMSAGEIHGVQFEMLRRDGSALQVEFDGKIGRDRSGNFERTHCVMRDVTVHKQSEAVLQYRADFDRIITGLSSDLIRLEPENIDRGIYRALQIIGEFSQVDRSYIYLMRDDGVTAEYSHEWCAEGIPLLDDNLKGFLFGQETVPWLYSRICRFEDIYIPSVSDLPLEAAKEKVFFQACHAWSVVIVPMVSGNKLRGVLGFDSVTSGREWSEDEIALLRLAGEIIMGALERKRTEEALRLSEERFRTLVDTLPQIVFEMELDGRLTYVNENAYGQFGYSPADLKAGFNALNLLIPEDRPRARQNIARRLKGEKSTGTEYMAVRKNGSHFPIEVHTQVARHRGRPIGLRGLMVDISDRKAIEIQLENTVSLLQATLESTADGILVIDGKGTVASFNQRFLEMWQIPRELADAGNDDDLLGHVLSQLSDPEAFLNKVRKLYGTPEAESFDEIEFKDGQLIERYSRPQWLGNKIIGRVWSFRDVTKRRRSEEALRENQEMFSKAFLSSPALMAITSVKNKTFVEVNDTFLKTLGYRKEEIIGHTVRELELFADYSQRDEIVNRVLKQGSARDLEVTVRAKNGELRHGMFSADLIHINDEPHLLTLMVDVTERRQHEEALRKSEKLQSTIIRATKEAIIAVGEDGMISLFNPAAESMFGRTKAEMIGQPLDNLMPEKYRKKHREYLRSYFTTSKPNAAIGKFVELPGLHSDGHEFPMAISLSATEIDGRQLVLAVARDITEQKQMEQELLKSQKLESLGLLAGGIAHDFNNLLAGILGNVSLARQDTVDLEENRICLAAAEKAALRAQDLTLQLLTFSKGGEPIKRATSISDIVGDSARFAARGSNARLELSFADNLSAAEVDAGQISQVIHNLVLNANQAMPHGGTIKVTCSNTKLEDGDSLPLAAGDYILITVADEGVGIPGEHLAKIFDPYFTTKPGGSGLGLATSYSIIKKHGGHLQVASTTDKGTVFTIHIPATDDTVRIGTRTKEALTAGTGRILMMDDEDIIRDLMGKVLRNCGYIVDTVTNGEDALKLYRKAVNANESYAVVILDLTIPGGMGGKDTIRKLLEIDPHVRAIVCSGYSNDPVMAAPEEYGFCGFVSKPFKPSSLSEVVQQALEGSGVPLTEQDPTVRS
ncbi:MAG: PAS domain S-box protein [bacterium]